MGAARCWSGGRVEGGGKEMICEFIPREDGKCGERGEASWDGRILGMINRRLRANVYAPAAVGGEWDVILQMVVGRLRGRERR